MARSLVTELNESNPSKIASGLKVALVGTALGRVPAFVRGTVTSHVLALPNDQKAAAVISGFSVAGTLTGQFTATKINASVTTGLVGVNAVGNILFATADAVTLAEVYYQPFEGDVVTETIVVPASGIATGLQGKIASLLISATQLTGSVVGAKTVLARGATPATGQVAVGATGTIVFLAADAGASGGTATVTYIATPGVGTATPSLAARLATQVDF